MCDPSCHITHHCHSLKPHYYPVSSLPIKSTFFLRSLLACAPTHTVAKDGEAKAVLSWMSQQVFAHIRGGSSSINPKRGFEVVWRGKTTKLDLYTFSLVKLHQINPLIVSLQNTVSMNEVVLAQWGRHSCSLTCVQLHAPANKDACLQDWQCSLWNAGFSHFQNVALSYTELFLPKTAVCRKKM